MSENNLDSSPDNWEIGWNAWHPNISLKDALKNSNIPENSSEEDAFVAGWVARDEVDILELEV